MADWASLSPNLPTHSPTGPLTLAKGSPTGRRGPGAQGALRQPFHPLRSRQWWFYRLTDQSWQGLGGRGQGGSRMQVPPIGGSNQPPPEQTFLLPTHPTRPEAQ